MKVNRLPVLSSLALAWLAIAPIGYALAPPGLTGELGRYTFHLNTTGQQDVPLAAGGARLRLYVTGSGDAGGCGGAMPWSRASSSAPEVLAITDTRATDLSLTTGAEGDAEITLHDANGQTVDRVRLRVRATTAVREVTTGAVLMEGSPVYRCFQTLAGTTPSAGTGTLRFDFVGPLRIADSDPDPDPNCGTNELVWIVGEAGQATMTIASPAGVHATRAYRIVKPSEIATVTITTLPPDGTGDSQYVFAKAALADGTPVLGPRCEWTADPSVKRTTEPRAQRVEHDAIRVELTRPGTFEIKCTIGGASAKAVLKRTGG